MSKASNIIQGFLIGATAGVLTGVLVAPDKGERTRKRLKISFDRLSKKISDKFDEQTEELKEKFNKAEEEAKETVKQAAKEAAKDAVKKTTTRTSRAKKSPNSKKTT